MPLIPRSRNATRLPLNILTVPVREGVLIANSGVASVLRYPAVIWLLAPNASSSVFAAHPFGKVLRALHEQKSRAAGDALSMRIGERAQTTMVMAYVDIKTSNFECLQLAQKAARAALETHPARILLQSALATQTLAASALNAMVAGIQAAAFQLASFKSDPKKSAPLRRIDIAGIDAIDGLPETIATAGGNNLARWLTALPPNELDAGAYRKYLQAFARSCGLRFKFYGERELKRLGAGAFLAVSQGNADHDAGIAHLSYRPRGSRARAICLVGKGICFDTGGTNLKSHKGMLDMHIDMAGSAVALGSLWALQQLHADIPLDCWLAITENRTGPTAYKPQDIVRALNGTTIQIIHTDAEGRMVLADTLALAARGKPRAIVDYATLTGAALNALTERYSGAFTNRLDSREMIEAAGLSSGERVWCFPMDKDFETDLESSVADVLQCAVDGKGDHILAALFLQRFVPNDIAWLHLDLAAAMRRGGLAQIGTEITGFGVRYTVDLLRRGWPHPKAA